MLRRSLLSACVCVYACVCPCPVLPGLSCPSGYKVSPCSSLPQVRGGDTASPGPPQDTAHPCLTCEGLAILLQIVPLRNTPQTTQLDGNIYFPSGPHLERPSPPVKSRPLLSSEGTFPGGEIWKQLSLFSLGHPPSAAAGTGGTFPQAKSDASGLCSLPPRGSGSITNYSQAAG